MKVEDKTLGVLRLGKRDEAKKKIAEEQQRLLHTDVEDASPPEAGSDEANAAVLEEDPQTDEEPVFNVTQVAFCNGHVLGIAQCLALHFSRFAPVLHRIPVWELFFCCRQWQIFLVRSESIGQ